MPDRENSNTPISGRVDVNANRKNSNFSLQADNGDYVLPSVANLSSNTNTTTENANNNNDDK